MSRNAFIDPATGDTYVWPTNHQTEDKWASTRSAEETFPVAAAWVRGVRPTMQQGLRAPLSIRLSGEAFTDEQQVAFAHFRGLSIEHSIYFVYGPESRTFECFLTRYEMERKPVVSNPRGLRHTWAYSIDIDVVQEV